MNVLHFVNEWIRPPGHRTAPHRLDTRNADVLAEDTRNADVLAEDTRNADVLAEDFVPADVFSRRADVSAFFIKKAGKGGKVEVLWN